MKRERKYITINYNKKLKQQVSVIFYVVDLDDFGKSYIQGKNIYIYNNIFHFIKNGAKHVIDAEIQTGCEVLENVEYNVILRLHQNMINY